MLESAMSSDAPTVRDAVSVTAWVTILSLLGLIVAGWAALALALPMSGAGWGGVWAALCQPVTASGPWAERYSAALAVWIPMIPAMMLPSAIPMALSFADRIERQGGAVRPLLLLAGFLGVWTGAALVFAGVQTLGNSALAALRLPDQALGILGGFAIGSAGLWQFAPLKRLSLAACRHDFSDISLKPGYWETLLIGARQGFACIGCCWVLMVASAFAGAMNLVWMALLAAIMTAEKLIGPRATVPLGVGLIAIGLALAVSAVGPAALLSYWRG